MPTAPSLVQDNTGNTGTATSSWTITPTLSAGATAGNIIVVAIVSDSTFSTTYSGWSLIKSVVSNSQTTGFYRTAAGSETSFTGPTVASQTAWWIGEFTSVDAAIFDVTTPTWTGTATASRTYAGPSTGTTTIAETRPVAVFGTSIGGTPGSTVTSYSNSFTGAAHGTSSTNRAQTSTNVGVGVASLAPNAINTYTTTATAVGTDSPAWCGGIFTLRGATTATPKSLTDSGTGATAITGQLITFTNPAYGSSTASIAGIDPTDWVNPGNVYADDTSYATWSP